MSDRFGLEFVDERDFVDGVQPPMTMLGELLLYQSGSLTEFGPLDQSDRICIDSLQVTVKGIRIKASLGEKQVTFFLQTIKGTVITDG